LVLPMLEDRVRAPSLRFQQTSGMIMAKGVEDRAFYRWSRLTSLNEVGADPSEFAVTPDAFHAAMARRQATAPDAMTTLSTHDTKRGEDVRARISVLAEDPAWWADTLDALLAAAPAPDPGFAHLLLQAAVGAWPISRERLHGYAEKAMREAGDRTTWTAPVASYEDAVHGLVDALYDDPSVTRLVEDAVARLAGPGWSNALSAKLLSLTVPGVPDVYQGSELWEQSLVDPDNRRAVDFSLRERLLADADPARVRPPAGAEDDGRAKLHVVRTALRLRRDRPDRFTGYDPVAASGAAARHVVAFDRGGALSVVTRLPLGLERGGGWRDTMLALPPGEWHDLLTDRPATAEVGRLLDRLPVALLVREDG
ncbi:MAG TPA: malto-oligosyltrehalose synthase, partial [Nocardioides sp.]|nr:malto-oligosyltrehalose synthase [Nocardioides sp.]